MSGINARSALALGVVMVELAACGQTQPIEPPPRFQQRPLVPGIAAEQVEELTERQSRYDDDGDGFVSPAEAEGYYRRYFGQLDDNNDGRLSRAELKPEPPGAPASSWPTRSWSGGPSRNMSTRTCASTTCAPTERSA